MKRIFIIILVLIACTSQMFAQLVILNEQDEVITNRTVNITNEIYFKVKNNSSSDITGIKCYVRISADENAEYGTDAEWEFCTTGCGLNGACPAFDLAAGAVRDSIHLSFSQVNAPSDFMIYTYQQGGEPAIFTIHIEPLGISNITTKSFIVYPSPANESFTIENGFGKNSYVEIYNVLGQTVKRIQNESNSRISVNCSTWKNGYYVCRLYNEGKIEKTVKIVVSH